ncbi:hypothetical protein [Comamonas antarctica]|uniref:hypothetical protein n=1 Tax=Comamonas antarctica TaxID=2743470 RepID=UPI0028ECBA97|nr:hypothetical protein [Comamonas antarctica]
MTKPLNAFTAPATIRWARHEQARPSRNTGPGGKSISIAPPVGTHAERRARTALFEAQQDVIERYKRALQIR